MKTVINITNHSSVPDAILQQMIAAAVDAYQDIYEAPSCDVEITVCRDRAEMNQLALEHTGDTENKEYNGMFLCPHDQHEPFRILLLVKDDAVVGAKRFFQEVENGSQRDEDMPQEERERRGLELAAYCHFVEMLQHEYSHLCSCERLMLATDWEDPLISAHSQDYHLYDETIARYRGTYAMLVMMQPYMEIDLLYTMWMGYWNDLLKSYQKETEALKDFLTQQRNEIEAQNLEYMHYARKSGREAIAEMERELGHPLKFHNELTEKGAPKLTAEEVAEFLLCDDFEDPELNETIFRKVTSLVYFAKNPYATYEGAQIEGLVHAFYDFLRMETGQTVGERKLELNSVIDTPYYKTANLLETNEEVKQFADLFMKLQKIRK